MEEEVIRITLEGPGGEELTYDMVGTFTAENGKDYMALQPADSGDSEVYLTGFHAGPNDEVVLDDITDEEEYREVSDTFLQLFNEPLAEEYDLGAMYEAEEALLEADGPDDYCYEDAEGRLFVYGPNDVRIYLDANGDYILDKATVAALAESGAAAAPEGQEAAGIGAAAAPEKQEAAGISAGQ